jgi:hypothetical protein
MRCEQCNRTQRNTKKQRCIAFCNLQTIHEVILAANHSIAAHSYSGCHSKADSRADHFPVDSRVAVPPPRAKESCSLGNVLHLYGRTTSMKFHVIAFLEHSFTDSYFYSRTSPFSLCKKSLFASIFLKIYSLRFTIEI